MSFAASRKAGTTLLTSTPSLAETPGENSCLTSPIVLNHLFKICTSVRIPLPLLPPGDRHEGTLPISHGFARLKSPLVTAASVSLYFCLSRVCNVRRPLVYFELHKSESVFHHSRGPFEHSLGNNTSNLTSTPAVDVGVGLHFLTVTSDLIHRLFADLRHLQLSKKMNPALKVLDDALKNRPIPSSFDAVKGAPEAERSSVVNENIPNITATDRATILTAWKNAVQDAGPAQGAAPA
ncbi:hypothetical protein PROFUN_15849, partial [Planoprotostelium fungivorum]